MTQMPKTDAVSRSNAKDDDVESQLLQIVETLAEELRAPFERSIAINLDSDLDRDLGLDSLGRAELIFRVDKAFRIKLPDRILVEANSPRDLLNAVRIAGPALSDHLPRVRSAKPSLPQIEAPSTADTLIDVLGYHTVTHPDRPHLRVWISDDEEDCISYSDLHNAALNVAGGLNHRGALPGDRIAIMLATKADFFQAFFGALYAGGIPVPIYPPFRRSQVEDHLRRQAGILNNAKANFLIVGEEMRNVGSLLFGLAENLTHIETVSDLTKDKALDGPVPASPETVALIQYTSGSTGDPKGVVLTHANLLANIRAMGEVLEASSDDVFVSWLPLYHDMGLIGAWLGSLYYGATAIIMPPLAFLAAPSRWLRTISNYRATLSAAPNFAFELCCKNIHDEEMKGLDLGSLRMIVNGAEPVSPITISRFSQRFAPFGFKQNMMGPVYGLAENSVGLAFPPMGRAPIIERVERLALSRDGKAVLAAAEDQTALSFVACGRPIPRHEIRIVDDANREVPERTEGRLQFRGPAATSGYFRNPEKNQTLFSGDWLESGDRAYIANGDVYLTGRIKDMIIKAGRNIYPHELEELVGQVEGVRRGCVAAVASTLQSSETEQLVLVVETRILGVEAKNALKQRINYACTAKLNMPPDVIALVPPHTVPKTSSGKIQRAATRQLYETGQLTSRQKKLWLQLLGLAVSGASNRIWRFFRRSMEFTYAAYWWISLVLIAIFIWPLVLLLPKRDWRHFTVHLAAKGFLGLTGMTPRISGIKPIPRSHAVLTVNHSSYLDSLVIVAAIPGRTTFIAKEELSRQWIAGPFLKRLGAIFVRRTIASGGIEDTKRQLEAAITGERILSFPEGTFTRMPGLLGFRLGAFIVAAQSGIPVVPVILDGTRSILRAGQWFPHHGKIAVHVSQLVSADGNDFAAAVRLRNEVRAVMLKHSREPDLSREQTAIPADQ